MQAPAELSQGESAATLAEQQQQQMQQQMQQQHQHILQQQQQQMQLQQQQFQQMQQHMQRIPVGSMAPVSQQGHPPHIMTTMGAQQALQVSSHVDVVTSPNRTMAGPFFLTLGMILF